MAWYWWLLIILTVLITLISWGVSANRKDNELLRKKRQKEFLEDISTWQVGDELITTDRYRTQAENNGLKYPKLWKWDKKEVLIDVGNEGSVTLINHWEIEENRSDVWRNRHARMDKFMSSVMDATNFMSNHIDEDGKKVESQLDVQVKAGQIWINDMPLLGMTEIHLNVFSKICMEEGNEVLLKKIQQELTKHK